MRQMVEIVKMGTRQFRGSFVGILELLSCLRQIAKWLQFIGQSSLIQCIVSC